MDIEELRREILQLIDSNNIRYEQRFSGQEEAVRKAEAAVEKRFESVNEFRAQLSDQAGRFITRNEWDEGHQHLKDQVDSIDKKFSEYQGRGAGITRAMMFIMAAVTVFSVAVSLYEVFHK